jgi:hypothetical protein
LPRWCAAKPAASKQHVQHGERQRKANMLAGQLLEPRWCAATPAATTQHVEKQRKTGIFCWAAT